MALVTLIGKSVGKLSDMKSSHTQFMDTHSYSKLWWESLFCCLVLHKFNLLSLSVPTIVYCHPHVNLPSHKYLLPKRTPCL